MTQDIVVQVAQRSDRGKNSCRRLRAAGQVPGIVYGLDLPPFSIAVSPRRMEEILKLESGKNTIFSLALEGGEAQQQRAVMIREIQRDPVSEAMIHIDFVRLDLTGSVVVNVPIRLLGTPEGVKNEAGVLDFVNRQVSVECLPAEIPQHLDADVSELHNNQHVSVGDLQVDDKVRVLDPPETIVAVVIPPRAELEEAAAAEEEEKAEAEAEEPEVIKKGKEAEPTEDAEAKSE